MTEARRKEIEDQAVKDAATYTRNPSYPSTIMAVTNAVYRERIRAEELIETIEKDKSGPMYDLFLKAKATAP